MGLHRKEGGKKTRRGGGGVGQALGALASLGSAGRATVLEKFREDMQDAEDERLGAEWEKEQLEKTQKQASEMGNNMKNVVSATRPMFDSLMELKKMRAQLEAGGSRTRRNKTSGGDIVSHLLTIRNQVKLYHWQTASFARHKASDDLTAALDTNIDAFVESYMGRYGRPSVSGSIKLHNFSESAAKSFVAKETAYLQKVLPRKIGKNDTDLLNLRDTILGDLTKVLYLFTLQ
jgi:hypothetical protein